VTKESPPGATRLYGVMEHDVRHDAAGLPNVKGLDWISPGRTRQAANDNGSSGSCRSQHSFPPLADSRPRESPCACAAVFFLARTLPNGANSAAAIGNVGRPAHGCAQSPVPPISSSLSTLFTPVTRLLMRVAIRKSQSSKTIPCKVTMPFITVTVTCSS